MRIYKIVGIVLSAILLLASCTNSDLEKKKVKIAYANWLEGIAMSHLAKVVLEEHGYEVELLDNFSPQHTCRTHFGNFHKMIHADSPEE